MISYSHLYSDSFNPYVSLPESLPPLFCKDHPDSPIEHYETDNELQNQGDYGSLSDDDNTTDEHEFEPKDLDTDFFNNYSDDKDLTPPLIIVIIDCKNTIYVKGYFPNYSLSQLLMIVVIQVSNVVNYTRAFPLGSLLTFQQNGRCSQLIRIFQISPHRPT